MAPEKISQALIHEALSKVMDPELGRNIVDLGMVKEVSVDEKIGRVDVTVALTIAGCPLHSRIQQDVEARVGEAPGVKDVRVTMTAMTEEERRALAERLRAQAREGAGGAGGAEGASGASDAEAEEEDGPKSRILAPDSPTIVIGVASGKGGVGKSTVTVNLAAALARLGKKVGLLDADIYGFSVPRMMGLKGRPAVLDDAIVPMQAYGVKVISMGSFVEEDTPVIWRGPMLMKALDQFLNDVLWGDLDYFLLDMPPGTGDIPISLYQRIPHSKLIIVTTPQKVAASVARRVGTMAEKTNQTVIGVVENMSYFLCPHCGEKTELLGKGGGEMVADQLGVPLLGQIPMEREVWAGADEGEPAVVAGEAEAGRVFEAIARKVVDATVATTAAR